MAKCPKCGIEIDDGMKFCGECGTRIIQTKKCPKCGKVWPETMRFCGECGHDFGGEGGGSAGVIGDRNVIAGDVNVNNTTNIINRDQTKDVVKCVVCGRGVVITKAYQCSVCGQYVCESHYDDRGRVCDNCRTENVKKIEDEYRKALEEILEDGIIDRDEFERLEQLRKKLGMTVPRAMELQKQMKVDIAEKKSIAHGNVALMTVEKAQCERAKEKLYDEGDFSEVVKLVQTIYQNHPWNEEVLSIYMTALARIDESKVRAIINALPVDLPSAYAVLIDLELRHGLENGDMAAAEVKLASAESLWPQNSHVKYRRILLMCVTARLLDDRTHLAEAMDMLTSMPASVDKLEASWAFYLQYAISHALGDDVPELTPELCEKNGVYYSFVKGEVLGFPHCKNSKTHPSSCDCQDLLEQASNLDSSGEVDKAIEVLERAAELGSVEAMEELGKKYLYDKEDAGKAESWLKKAILGGSDVALHEIVMLYLDDDLYAKNDGRTRNEAEAVRYMKLAANKGDAFAAYQLAGCYFSGDMGVSCDMATAIAYYKQAAELGSEEAMRALGLLYYKGGGIVAKDPELAIMWYKRYAGEWCDGDSLNWFWWCSDEDDIDEIDFDPYYKPVAILSELRREHPGHFNEALKLTQDGVEAYEKGDFEESMEILTHAINRGGGGEAWYYRALMYRDGFGVEKDIDQWKEELRLAAMGFGKAALELAEAYRTGNFFEKDEKLYVRYTEIAAHLGEPVALNRIGFWYDGAKNGYKRDCQMANEFYLKAAEKGNASAMYNLSMSYANGDGVSVDIGKSIMYLKQATDAGHIKAPQKLALRYLDGNGVRQDITQGVKYMLIAADRGDGDALNYVGVWYDSAKHGYKRDHQKANEYYLKAVEKGNAWAMRNLAMNYANGNGVPVDIGKFIMYLKQATEAGHAEAPRILALRYLNGDGVQQDVAIGKSYMKVAAERGDSDAKKYLESH